MKRPAEFAYWLDEVPPPGVVFLSALQHVGLICSLIAIPLAVAREAGLAPDQTVNLVAVSMLVLGITQLLNLLFVPLFAHAGLTLAISVGALINALLLLVGLIRRKSYVPLPGWGLFSAQVFASTALLAVFLMWAAGSLRWLGPGSSDLFRIGQLALVMLGAAVLYFAVLALAGLKLRQLLRR